MKNGHEKQIVARVREHSAEASAESVIAISLAYAAPLPPKGVPSLEIFFIHNILMKVRDAASSINELSILDIGTVEQMARDAWFYRVNSLTVPPVSLCPGTEGWTMVEWDLRRDISEYVCCEFGEAI